MSRIIWTAHSIFSDKTTQTLSDQTDVINKLLNNKLKPLFPNVEIQVRASHNQEQLIPWEDLYEDLYKISLVQPGSPNPKDNSGTHKMKD